MNIHEAKTHFSRIIERVEAGEQVVISRAGRPVALVIPIGAAARLLGGDEGRVWVSPDFDAPLPDEVQAAFEGTAR